MHNKTKKIQHLTSIHHHFDHAWPNWLVQGGGGGTQQSVIRKGSGPRMKPLSFYLPFLIGKVPLSYTFHRKLYRLLLNVLLEEPLKYLDESAVTCVCSRYFLKSLPFYIPPAWKGYPFRSKPPHTVRYRECLPPPEHNLGKCLLWENQFF